MTERLVTEEQEREARELESEEWHGRWSRDAGNDATPLAAEAPECGDKGAGVGVAVEESGDSMDG